MGGGWKESENKQGSAWTVELSKILKEKEEDVEL